MVLQLAAKARNTWVRPVAYVWIGLLVGFYLPYPPSFFITAFAFITFVAVRGLLTGVAGGRHARR